MDGYGSFMVDDGQYCLMIDIKFDDGETDGSGDTKLFAGIPTDQGNRSAQHPGCTKAAVYKTGIVQGPKSPGI